MHYRMERIFVHVHRDDPDVLVLTMTFNVMFLSSGSDDLLIKVL